MQKKIQVGEKGGQWEKLVLICKKYTMLLTIVILVQMVILLLPANYSALKNSHIRVGYSKFVF